jgi:hypothetical protein
MSSPGAMGSVAHRLRGTTSPLRATATPKVAAASSGGAVGALASDGVSHARTSAATVAASGASGAANIEPLTRNSLRASAGKGRV